MESKVGENTPTDLLCLLLRDLLACLDPVYLDAMTFRLKLFFGLFPANNGHLGTIVSLGLLIIHLSFDRHTNASLDDREEED